MNFRRIGLALSLTTLLAATDARAQQRPIGTVPGTPAQDGTEASAPEVWKVPVGKSPSRGPKDALVTLVVFSDFECPYCKRLAPTFDELTKRYPNELRIVFKQNPLPFHADAGPAAELALEAFAQGKDKAFWQVHDALFAAETLDEQALEGIAKGAKLDVTRALAAVREKKHLASIAMDQELAESVEANGTPTSFLNGVKLGGARPIEDFVEAVDAALVRAKALRAKGVPPAKVYEASIANGRTADDEPLERRDIPSPSEEQPSRGPKNAPVTVHLFTDFQCPFCSRAQAPLEEVERHFKGKVRLVYHSMPLSFHQHAREAAAFALEARAQKGDAAFWKAHDVMFANQDALTRADLLGYAATLGLDAQKVEAALSDGRHNLAIDTDLELASKAGIDGTPTFVINGYEVVGAQPFRAFRRVIERALKEAKPSKKK